MRRVLHIILTTVSLLIFNTGCSDWFTPTKVDKRMVLLYIAATESALSPYADGNITDMLSGYVPSKGSKEQELLVFFQNRDINTSTQRSEATLSRYYSDRSGRVVQDVIRTWGEDFDCCNPESFAEVLATAEKTCTPTYRCLLFSSHGTGWMPVGYFDGGGEATVMLRAPSKSTAESDVSNLSRIGICESLGYDAPTKNEIDIRDFATELGKYHWESALLDCCYMGTIEVAYQLRNCCDWVIGSPTEILITGFPYPSILDQLFNHPGREGLETICREYYELYQGQSGQLQSGTIGLTKCSELDRLAEICAAIVRENRDAMNGIYRNGVQHYFYKASKDFFFDFSHYFEQFAPEDSFTEFTTQLNLAVPYKNSTAKFLGVEMQHYSGLSCYIPSTKYPKLNAYYKQLAWNQKVKVLK